MNDFNRKVENASARVNKSVAEATERIEKETAEFITYLNEEVVPAVRRHRQQVFRCPGDQCGFSHLRRDSNRSRAKRESAATF